MPWLISDVCHVDGEGVTALLLYIWHLPSSPTPSFFSSSDKGSKGLCLAQACLVLPLLLWSKTGSVSSSSVQLSVTPRTLACQALLSMEFSRQWRIHWSGLPSLGDLLHPGIELRSPALQADSLPVSHQGSPNYYCYLRQVLNYVWTSTPFSVKWQVIITANIFQVLPVFPTLSWVLEVSFLILPTPS